MIKAKPIPMCGKYVGQASKKKITYNIYSENNISKIITIVNNQFFQFLFLLNFKIEFINTNKAIIVGIKNQ